MIPVWKMFCDKPYVEKSQVEDFVYYEGPTGVFFRQKSFLAQGHNRVDSRCTPGWADPCCDRNPGHRQRGNRNRR